MVMQELKVLNGVLPSTQFVLVAGSIVLLWREEEEESWSWYSHSRMVKYASYRYSHPYKVREMMYEYHLAF